MHATPRGTPSNGLYGGLQLKGVPFLGLRYMKQKGFYRWRMRKGKEICHLGLGKGPKELTDEFYGFQN